MRTRYFAVTACMLLLATFVNAQPGGKKPVPNQQSDFEFEVTVTPLGLAGVVVRRKSGLGLFTPEMLSSFANQSAKSPLNPSFAVRPDKDAKIADILAAINALRISPKADLRIEVDADLTIFIPKKLDPNAIPRPNPLTLVVSVDATSGISLNGEKEGSFPNTSKLEQHLKQIFQDRRKNGLAETTVLISFAKNMTFTNLDQLARALRSAGSNMIGLQVDETNMLVEMELTKP
ncbi:MAG TPA: hypothetical protein PLL77_00905 [Pyrinomonadaceae bacterium]|nr:hypothetical protein [Pyrinomonadaceae bacterium]